MKTRPPPPSPAEPRAHVLPALLKAPGLPRLPTGLSWSHVPSHLQTLNCSLKGQIKRYLRREGSQDCPLLTDRCLPPPTTTSHTSVGLVHLPPSWTAERALEAPWHLGTKMSCSALPWKPGNCCKIPPLAWPGFSLCTAIEMDKNVCACILSRTVRALPERGRSRQC